MAHIEKVCHFLHLLSMRMTYLYLSFICEFGRIAKKLDIAALNIKQLDTKWNTNHV